MKTYPNQYYVTHTIINIVSQCMNLRAECLGICIREAVNGSLVSITL